MTSSTSLSPTAADAADRARQIAAVNDGGRRRLPLSSPGFEVLLTRSVAVSDLLPEIFQAVRSFDEFGPDNDPYGEHDFAFVTVHGERYFFKIDAYDADREHGAADPLDPSTRRVLTIGHADDY